MNEFIFFAHVLVVVGSILFAVRLGKNAGVALIVLQSILANLFVVKQISLFGFAVTCSDVFAIGGILALNLLQEYFGKEAAKEAIQISFLGLVFFSLMSQIHLLYVPTPADGTHGAFSVIFSSSTRIVLASIAVFYFVQKIDLWLFGFLKGRLSSLSLRIGISLFCSQLLDTVLFSFLGLYGLVASIFDVIALSFLIKCLVITSSSTVVGFAKKWVRREVSL